MSRENAARALRVATSHLARVQSAWWDPGDAVQAVTFAFYSYENAVVALAELHGRPWTKNHYEKARLAHQLFTDGVIETDVSDRLRAFNELRKDVAYDEPGPELSQLDLQSIAIDLERFIDEVSEKIDAAAAEE